MLSYSTRDLPAAAKVSYWNDVITDVFTPMETKPWEKDGFEAEVHAAQLGHLWLANPVATPGTVVRSRQHASRSKEHRFFLHMQMKGELLLTQDGKEAMLSEGDLVLCDATQPYTLSYREACSTLVAIVPADAMRKHLPSPEQIIGLKLTGQKGLSQTASVMLKSLWNVADGLPEEIGARIAEDLLDVFAAAWASTYGLKIADTATISSRRLHIRRFIEANLRDPDLTVRKVAAAFGISTRYLHMLFANDDETVSSYILRRRLEACVKQLVDPLWRRRTITEIAFGWGFNNATHFARVFRDHYGMTPRDYRGAKASPTVI